MKRDLDVCRQLLFDLEAHGPECTISALRNAQDCPADDRLRFHLCLLVDAGLVKEVNRSAGGTTRLRLTHAGLELIELCRSDARWREAKQVVLERTGGLSLAVLRAVLTKWAVEAVSYGATARPRHTYYSYLRRVDPAARQELYHYDRRPLDVDEDLHLVRTGPDYREPLEWQHWPQEGPSAGDDAGQANVGVSLPIYLV